jgi:putative hydrolase of the HAD superfamily
VAERLPLDAVLLDAGGTLLRIDFEWIASMLASLGVNVSAETVRRGEVEGRRRYDRSRGHEPPPGMPPSPLGQVGDVNAYFGGMLEAAGVPRARIDEALALMDQRQAEVNLWTRAMEGARGALDELVAMGLPCAVVSNSDGRAEKQLRDCDMLRGLAFVVDSHQVGIEKPDAGIFRIALERLQVAAPRTLFVGDIRSVDEAGAAAAGCRFVLLDPYRDYAPPGTPAIARIADLPAWVRAHFTTGAPNAPRAVGP